MAGSVNPFNTYNKHNEEESEAAENNDGGHHTLVQTARGIDRFDGGRRRCRCCSCHSVRDSLRLDLHMY